MSVLVLDSGGLSMLASGSPAANALLRALRHEGIWPPLVPSVVLVESLSGAHRDAKTNRLLAACAVVTDLPIMLARRAAFLRAKARRGSAVDAIVVAYAEPGGTVLTSDRGDLEALAAYASAVAIEAI